MTNTYAGKEHAQSANISRELRKRHHSAAKALYTSLLSKMGAKNWRFCRKTLNTSSHLAVTVSTYGNYKAWACKA